MDWQWAVLGIAALWILVRPAWVIELALRFTELILVAAVLVIVFAVVAPFL